MTSVLPNIPDTGQFSIAETARILGISRQTLYTRMQSGWIHFHNYRDSSRKYCLGKDIKTYCRRRG